ncbi:TPA: AAA family ATPase [Legionella pneumophila]|nr:AAA family ATPase [Legionella pneumophila]
MHLESISIENFRIFEKLELTLNPGLNLLVGENDSGKTALIDAIRYVLGTNSSERLFLNESDFYNDTKELSIQLKFVAIEKHAHIFVEHLSYEEEPTDTSKTRAVLYVQLSAKNTGQERRGYPLIISELRSGRNGNGLTLETEIRIFLSTTYLKPLRDAESELSAGRGSRLSQILNSSKDLLKPESIQSILQIISDTNKELIEEGKPIHNTSKRIQDDYLHQLIFEKDKSFLKAIIDIAGIKDISNLTDEKKRKHLRTVLEGLNLSLTEQQHKHGLGYNNLLFMAAEMLLLEQELDSEFPLLLIEEPEAHLHPQLQMKLLQFITNRSKTKDNQRGIQCILSTHSPNISSNASPENIIILNKGKTFSLRPEETELEEENYKFLRKFLDVTKANLFFSRGVILVEGDAENILLPTIAKLLGRPLEDYGVSIINIGNTGWKHFAKIFLRKGQDKIPEFWNPIKVAVLRDLDLWPDCAEEKAGNIYGFKNRKPRNANYWENGKDIASHKNNLKKDNTKNTDTLERQNISIQISDKWTLEYCLSFSGLFDECFKAIESPDVSSNQITGTDEEKATFIQREIDNSKTDFATRLVLILESDYKDKPKILKNKLPQYIVAAIEHVTERLQLDQKEEGTENVST